MQNQRLYESVGEYIDKYYVDKPEDIRSDDKEISLYLIESRNSERKRPEPNMILKKMKI